MLLLLILDQAPYKYVNIIIISDVSMDTRLIGVNSNVTSSQHLCMQVILNQKSIMLHLGLCKIRHQSAALYTSAITTFDNEVGVLSYKYVCFDIHL